MDRAKVISVSDVLAEERSKVHETCSKAVLHQVPESETSLFSVNPGETLAPHLHTRTWDLFFVVSGSGEIRYRGQGDVGTVRMPVRAFCAMPPGYEHEVCNLSATEPFSFILIHTPWQGYDFVRTRKQHLLRTSPPARRKVVARKNSRRRGRVKAGEEIKTAKAQ